MGDMNDNNNFEGAGAQSSPQSSPQSSTPPANATNQQYRNPLSRFFAWIRSTGMVRTDNRWIGGVCGGIARRLGWDPTLVRALVLVSTLLFGFGAALYAIGWALMPDERDGRILLEELFAGRWDWSCAGVGILLALAVFIPRLGWGALALSALVLWIIAQGGVRQQCGYAVVQSDNQPPVMVQPAPICRARRKPAGSLVVLTVLGAIFLSIAVMSVACGWSDSVAFEVVMPQITIWISSICLILGAILLVLGATGRRSGGLIPIAIIVVVAVCFTVNVAGFYVYTSRGINATQEVDNYFTVELGASRKSENAGGLVALQRHDGDVNYWVSDSSPETFSRLRRGVYFLGDSYDNSVANIDLTQYARWDHNDDEKNEYIDGCPAGQINLMVRQAQVSVTLPANCPYAFGSSTTMRRASDVSSLGSRRSFLYNNVSYVVFDDVASDGEATENSQYFDSFLINVVYGISGKVRVRYADSTSLPSYSEFVDKQVNRGGWDAFDDTTRKHYDIESGASVIAGEDADKTDKKEGEQ